jgi:hypothetical protein
MSSELKSLPRNFSGYLRRHFFRFAPVSVGQCRCSAQALLALASLFAQVAQSRSALPCESCQLYTIVVMGAKSAPREPKQDPSRRERAHEAAEGVLEC